MLGESAEHVSGTIVTGPKAADRIIMQLMQLEAFCESIGDVINVSGSHRSRDPQEEVLPRSHKAISESEVITLQ
ncbi:MAG: hypothetical protein J2P48_12400 [Alphaproteobacteria bacterium]|nr:hypothetical protein [Alphaproteobacteria bacterium]